LLLGEEVVHRSIVLRDEMRHIRIFGLSTDCTKIATVILDKFAPRFQGPISLVSEVQREAWVRKLGLFTDNSPLHGGHVHRNAAL
jgi:hypothetical protein